MPVNKILATIYSDLENGQGFRYAMQTNEGISQIDI